ncbi:MAG: hypothetical protein WCS01_09495, partial [bacterium]
MNEIRHEGSAKTDSQSGATLVVALLVCFTAAILCGSYVAYTMNSSYQTRRTIDYRKARAVADAALEYGTIRLSQVMANQPMYPCQTNYLQNLVNGITFTNSIDGYAITRPNGQPAFRISVDSDVITGVITNGSACRGADGDYQFFTITAGARNPQSGVTAVLQKKVQLLGVYLIRFGVFYEDDLEIIPGNTMSFSAGPVHGNHDLYLGGTLALNDRVTSHGNIYARRGDSGRTHTRGHMASDKRTNKVTDGGMRGGAVLIGTQAGVGLTICRIERHIDCVKNAGQLSAHVVAGAPRSQPVGDEPHR